MGGESSSIIMNKTAIGSGMHIIMYSWLYVRTQATLTNRHLFYCTAMSCIITFGKECGVHAPP